MSLPHLSSQTENGSCAHCQAAHAGFFHRRGLFLGLMTTCFSTSLCLCEPSWVLLFGRWSLLGAFHGPCCKRRERKRPFDARPFLRVSLREQSPYFSNPEGSVLQPLGPASTQSRKDPFCNVLEPRFAYLQTLRAQLSAPLAGGVPEQVGFSVGARNPCTFHLSSCIV